MIFIILNLLKSLNLKPIIAQIQWAIPSSLAKPHLARLEKELRSAVRELQRQMKQVCVPMGRQQLWVAVEPRTALLFCRKEMDTSTWESLIPFLLKDSIDGVWGILLPQTDMGWWSASSVQEPGWLMIVVIQSYLRGGFNHQTMGI